MTQPDDPRAADRNPPPRPARRKPYEKPALHVYGDLATLTRGLTSGSKSDGTSHPNKHLTS